MAIVRFKAFIRKLFKKKRNQSYGDLNINRNSRNI